MTDTQQILLGVTPPVIPSLLVLLGIFVNNGRFNSLVRRSDDMRDLWRAELRRVEEVLDVRLKHLAER